VTESRYSIQDARASFAEIIDDAQHHGRSTTITRRGKAAARIIPATAHSAAAPLAMTASRIRDLVQAELADINGRMALPIPDRAQGSTVRFLSVAASHHGALGQVGYEVLPWAQLADDIGPDFEKDTDPINDLDAAYIVEVTTRELGEAQYDVSQFVWPTPSTDHVELMRASSAIAKHAGLVRFINILTGGEQP
jgi:prevent-host-death family protein